MRDGLVLVAAGAWAFLALACEQSQRGASRDVAFARASVPEAKPDLYRSAVEARGWLDLALANGRTVESHRVDRDCSGYSSQLGHFSKPLEAHQAKKDVRFAFDSTRNLLGTVETTTEDGTATVNTTIVGPSLIYKAHDGAVEQGPFSVLALEQARLELAEESPLALLTAAVAKGGLMLDRKSSHDASVAGSVSVTFTGNDNLTRSLSIDRHSGNLTRCTTLSSDPMLGDELVQTDYEYDSSTNPQPSRIRRFRSGRVELDLECRSAASPAPDALATPAGYKTDLVAQPVSAPATATIARVSDNLYAVTFSALDSRSLVLVLARAVYVFEAPHGDEAGQLLLDAIRREVPNKPVQYLFLTHHHPEHAGGLRPFVAAGVKIVTTPGNVAYFQTVATENHALRPDAQWLHPQAPAFELVNGRRSFGDGEQSVEALDIGAQSAHTDEYLVCYFPKEKLVFEGDLVKAPREGEPLGPAGTRALGLYRYLLSSSLPVERIVSSWPAQGRAPSIPFATLAEMVRLRANATAP